MTHGDSGESCLQNGSPKNGKGVSKPEHAGTGWVALAVSHRGYLQAVSAGRRSRRQWKKWEISGAPPPARGARHGAPSFPQTVFFQEGEAPLKKPTFPTQSAGQRPSVPLPLLQISLTWTPLNIS